MSQAAKKLTTSRARARNMGAEAFANGEGVNAYRDDLAIAYGHKSWSALPRELRRDAMRNYFEGRRLEKILTR